MVGRRGIIRRRRCLSLPVALHAGQDPGHARHPGAGAAHPAPGLTAGVDHVDCVWVGGGSIRAPLQALARQRAAVQHEQEVVRSEIRYQLLYYPTKASCNDDNILLSITFILELNFTYVSRTPSPPPPLLIPKYDIFYFSVSVYSLWRNNVHILNVNDVKT